MSNTTHSIGYTGIHSIGKQLRLATLGCGCCSDSEPVTQQNIKEAIEDAEEWLAHLRAVEKSLKQQQGDS